MEKVLGKTGKYPVKKGYYGQGKTQSGAAGDLYDSGVRDILFPDSRMSAPVHVGGLSGGDRRRVSRLTEQKPENPLTKRKLSGCTASLFVLS